MRAYYNEFDPYAAAWLRNLIAAGHVADGDVDERSIVDVQASDLTGYTHAHFFAGIGGWSLALRLAGWPDDRPVWTGSCPCQPFSAAGKRKGVEDPRHLWPEFRRLIAECSPPVVFGEQVASADGRAWLAGVRVDLEDMAYAVGAADLCAAGAGAPHIRQRVWWVADAEGTGLSSRGARGVLAEPCGEGVASGLADADGGVTGDGGLQPRGQHGQQPEDGGAGGMGDADLAARERLGCIGLSVEPEQEAGRPGYANAWADCEPLGCSDGKTRRTQSGLFPLAHGVPNRVGRLRGYGNAIVPQVAAEFIGAWLETQP